MSGARGYSSYRGREPKIKIILAVLLVLVILTAAAVIYIQQNLVYGADGRPRLDLPWQEDAAGPEENSPPEEEPQVDLVVQEPEAPPSSLTLSLSAAPLTMEAWEAVRGESCDALCVTLKDAAGSLYFDAAHGVSGGVRTQADTAAALAALTGREDLASVARFACLHDPRTANSNVRNLALRNTGGYIFYDGNNSQWLDPTKPAAREYLCGLVGEIAALGFDEILLTDLSYPTEGKINKIDYNGDGPLEDNLKLLLTEIRAALEPYEGVTLSLELPEAVITTGYDPVSGQKLADLAPLVDRIYAVTEPDRAEALGEAVKAVHEETLFVPELTADDPDLSGPRLLLPAAPET